MTTKQKPAYEFRLGRIRAAVWANGGESGTRYNVTFSRLYKEGDEWRNSTSYGREDLPLLMKVADWAHSWTYEQRADQPQGDASAEE